MALDSRVIDAATAPGALWSPWVVAAQLGVRVVRVPMKDGLLGVSLYRPATVYLNQTMPSTQEDQVLTEQLLYLGRDWPQELIQLEAAFLAVTMAGRRR